MFYNEKDQEKKEERQRARYLSLQKETAVSRTKSIVSQIEHIRKSIIAINVQYRELGPAMKSALMVRGVVTIAALRQRLLFVRLIMRALRMPGLAMPSFAGIHLTNEMRVLIRKIIRKKNDMWMFQLRQQWLNNERAMAERGQKSVNNPWLNKNIQQDSNIDRMRAAVVDGKANVASQHNDYTQDRVKHWAQTIIDGRIHAKSLFNALPN